MRRRGLISVEEGLTFGEASARLTARKEVEKRKKTRQKAIQAACIITAVCAMMLCTWKCTVFAVRSYAAKAGVACATPAALWRRADVALVVFAAPGTPPFLYPRYEATSGDYVRSYEVSPQCPRETSRMRHKHIRAWSPLVGRRVNLTSSEATCLQHYADMWRSGTC